MIISVDELQRKRVGVQSFFSPNDLYLLPGNLSNHRLHPGGMVSEPDVCRSDLVPQSIGDDLHVVVPDDANTAVDIAQVDANRSSSLHLDLDQIGDLVELILRQIEQK